MIQSKYIYKILSSQLSARVDACNNCSILRLYLRISSSKVNFSAPILLALNQPSLTMPRTRIRVQEPPTLTPETPERRPETWSQGGATQCVDQDQSRWILISDWLTQDTNNTKLLIGWQVSVLCLLIISFWVLLVVIFHLDKKVKLENVIKWDMILISDEQCSNISGVNRRNTQNHGGLIKHI